MKGKTPIIKCRVNGYIYDPKLNTFVERRMVLFFETFETCMDRSALAFIKVPARFFSNFSVIIGSGI